MKIKRELAFYDYPLVFTATDPTFLRGEIFLCYYLEEHEGYLYYYAMPICEGLIDMMISHKLTIRQIFRANRDIYLIKSTKPLKSHSGL